MRIALVKLEDLKNINQVHKKMKHMIQHVSTMKKHKIDYENFKILDRATSDQMVLIKEMLHIDKFKPSLNKQKQSYYTCLL